jgi:NAD(P)H-flavin reductase
MRAAFRDAGDKTQLRLLFANQTEEDILLRDELEVKPPSALRAAHLHSALRCARNLPTLS